MRIARFDNNRVGIVQDDGIHDMTGALEQLPAHRYPFPRHDALIANLDIFENATTTRVVKLARAELLSPVANPGKIMAAPVNYTKHLEEALADKGIHHGNLIGEIHKVGIFLKATTDEGSVGWAEITDSHGSPRGLAGIIDDLAPLVIGRDPRPVEAVYWDLYRATRQSPGSVIAKALAGIENALLDLKARALGVPVYELFGGPTRDRIPMYWSHCGTTRARAWEVTRTPKLGSYDDVAALGREVVEHGYSAFKTNVVVPGDEPKVLMPGFNEGGGTLQAAEIADALVRLLEAFRAGTEGAARPIVDLNFNLEPEGCVRVARALEPFDLL